MKCSMCGDTMQKRGKNKAKTTQHYYCKKDDRWEHVSLKPDQRNVVKTKGDDQLIEKYVQDEVRNEKDLIRVCNINTDEWEIVEWTCIAGSWDAYRADSQKDLDFKAGQITGTVFDQGKIRKQRLYAWRVIAKLRRKVEEIKVRDIVASLFEDAKKYAPRYPDVKYPKRYGPGFVYEIAMPDIQFGRLTWAEESGENYDIKIAARVVRSALGSLLDYTRNFPLQQILLPIGHDFYNADNSEETTSHGTRQQEDTRWQKTFRAGRQLLIDMIDTCTQLAPVRVFVVPGNHDESRMFYIGETLQAWYRNQPHVVIDNDVKLRKYYQWDNNLLGLTHGYWEKLPDLPGLMSEETRKTGWALADNREFHVGDKHHKKDIRQDIRSSITGLDIRGVTIRQLRSLAGIDKWTFNKGFVGSIHAAESFLWDPEAGVVGNFTAKADKKDYE